MILTLFAQLTQVNVLHWIVGLYFYGILVNEGIGLILVIQTFYASTLSVLYKDIYPTSSIVWSTTFPFNIRKSHSYSLCFLTHMHKQCESMEWQKRWSGRPGGWPCTELLAPTIFHTLQHWYQYRYLGL